MRPYHDPKKTSSGPARRMARCGSPVAQHALSARVTLLAQSSGITRKTNPFSRPPSRPGNKIPPGSRPGACFLPGCMGCAGSLHRGAVNRSVPWGGIRSWSAKCRMGTQTTMAFAPVPVLVIHPARPP